MQNAVSMPYKISLKYLSLKNNENTFEKTFTTYFMKQPELGNKISAIRNQKGITQKELSEAGNIDIRTLQRIESGEVTPRLSTLKLIAGALSTDFNVFNGNEEKVAGFVSADVLLALVFTGMACLFSWILFSPIGPKNDFFSAVNLLVGIVYTITGVFFYYGFHLIGKMRENRLMQYGAFIILVTLPLFLISVLITTEFSFAKYISHLIVILSGINSIVFGIGLLKAGSQNAILYRGAGILQMLIAPFFIIPIPALSIVGCWLSIPFMLMLVAILYREYRDLKTQQVATV